jgi:Tfp pilus assembly protein PilO
VIRRFAVAGAAAAVVLVVFFLVVLRPTLARIGQVREQVTAEEGRAASLRLTLRQLRQAEQSAPVIMERLARFERLLPATPDLPSLITQLQAAATTSGVDLVSIAPSPPQALTGATGIQTISVTLQVRGGFFRLESFLTRLEDGREFQRVVEVTSLSIAPEVDPTTGLQTLSSTITLRMYVVQPNATLTGAAPAPAASPRPTPAGTASPAPSPSPSPSPPANPTR